MTITYNLFYFLYIQPDVNGSLSIPVVDIIADIYFYGNERYDAPLNSTRLEFPELVNVSDFVLEWEARCEGFDGNGGICWVSFAF